MQSADFSVFKVFPASGSTLPLSPFSTPDRRGHPAAQPELVPGYVVGGVTLLGSYRLWEKARAACSLLPTSDPWAFLNHLQPSRAAVCFHRATRCVPAVPASHSWPQPGSASSARPSPQSSLRLWPPLAKGRGPFIPW